MKLRELLGSPGVHIFMLAHTRGYTPYMRAREYTMMLSRRRRFRADGERAIIYLYMYASVRGVFLYENSGRLVLPCLKVLRRVECASEERKRYFARTRTRAG